MADPEGSGPRISVLVPTICRPAHLERCLGSLVEQTRKPDQVVVVVPMDRNPCDDIIARFRERLSIQTARGSEYGIVRAVNLALTIARGDVVSLLDDDAEAPPEWLERVARWFRNPSVGAAGGPHVPPEESIAVLPVGSRWDSLSWLGLSTGPRLHERMPEAQDAHFLGECGLSFRRELIREIDINLVGRDERFGDDVTFAVRSRGMRVVADPLLYVWHYHVRFSFANDHVPAASHVFATAHNQTYLWMKYLSPARRVAFLVSGVIIGDRAVKGLATFAGWALKNIHRPRRMMKILALIVPTARGRVAGIRTYRKQGREGNGALLASGRGQT